VRKKTRKSEASWCHTT